ncbi:MAG: hypothetical protein QOF30_2053 [Acidimicrobiaceae bacterium]|nr:hypothetical protein [Acidimicrobiaceae bacterium]
MAGASAAAEGRRAHRSARNHRLGSATLAVVAAALAVTWSTTGDRRLLPAALVALALSWWFRPAGDADRWQRGAAGEVATARLLARLPRRFVVLHDRCSPGAGGNIDHLIIGPSGLWVVDSKVRRARLRVYRRQVWAGESSVDVTPVSTQALRVGTALGVPATALVAVHGTELGRRGKKVTGVRIVPAARAADRIRRRRRGRHLSKREIVALAARAEQLFPPC